MQSRSKIALLSACAVAAYAGVAQAADALEDAFKQGKMNLDVRYRYEFVDQDGFSENAKASTLRTRFGYETGAFYGFKAALQGEHITVVGSERYNDTLNGKTQFPLVPEPAEAELNQAYISYAGLPGTELKVGRQVIALDNQRFIGDGVFRQNQQTFDAASVTNKSLNNVTLFYSYLWNTNRLLGDDSTLGNFSGDSHLFNAKWQFLPDQNLVGYAYLLDNEQVSNFSVATYGARLSGRVSHGPVTFLYELDGAYQDDYGDNTNTGHDAHYAFIQPGVVYNGFTVKVGYEVLSGDGVSSFQTPLATLHAMNGWADKFLTIPTTGLQEWHVKTSYNVKGVHPVIDGTNIDLFYLNFQSDKGSIDFGDEWDAQISKTFNDHYTVGVKYADYHADQFATDTQKIWLFTQMKF